MPVFDGTAFKQNDDAPWEFSFVANVKEISPFCGVPLKKRRARRLPKAEDPARITRLASYFQTHLILLRHLLSWVSIRYSPH